MKIITTRFIPVLLIIAVSSIFSITNKEYMNDDGFIPAQQIFMQVNNINTVFRTDGIFNYDKQTFPGGAGGLIWPVSSVPRKTADFATGLWIGAKVGPQRELRLAACLYSSHYSPGNIPVIGQVPPASVCSDSTWKGYLVNLTDQSLVNGGVRNKTAGGRQYTFVYTSWANWPIQKGAPYVEVNNIPGYQPGWNSDRPGIWNTTARPDEISYMVYMDYTNCTNNTHVSELSLPGGTPPLGVEIRQISFAFLLPGIADVYFMKWKIINRSALQWDSTYVAIADDGDLGDAFDDRAGCDSSKNMGYIYNADNNDPIYGDAPPALGYKLIECPINYTGNNSDTAHLPYGNFAGYKLLKMSAYNIFVNLNDPCFGDPDEAFRAYNFMRGKDGCGNTIINPITGNPTTFRFNSACPPSGWYDSMSTDRRQLLSTGPFTLNSGGERMLVAAVMVARGSNNLLSVCQLYNQLNSINYFYNQSFGGDPIGVKEISSEVPDGFMLYQNYPNPFNPTTKIRFSIPPLEGARGRSVKLIVYDIIGREVATLVNGELQPGTYEVEWPAPSGSAENCPSGVYFCTFSADNYFATKRMILIK